MFDPQAINNKNYYKAFTDNLDRPRTIDIAHNMLSHRKCHELQQKNNLYFLDIVEAASYAYTSEKFKFDLNYFQDNKASFQKNYSNMKRTESRDEYALNRYIESLFIQMDKDLDIEIHEYHNFQNILAPYSGAELKRLQIMMYEIIRIYTYKWLSILAFDLDAFDVASIYHDYAVILYGGGTVQLSYESGAYYKEQLSISNTRAANIGAKEKKDFRIKKKLEYIAIHRNKGFKNMRATAEYIKQYVDTDEKPAYETVYRWLREANKGDFS
jgi:hypothetical protein